jgi:hypothetical protein
MSGRLFAIHDALDSDAWYTPPEVFKGMGVEFDLDVAHPEERISWLPAKATYTVADDGLTQEWFGWVWCNPPYSAPTQWCYRWARHDPGGAIVLRADLSTRGPFAAYSAASSMHVPPRRLEFVTGSGARSGVTNFSTVILGRGKLIDDALQRLAAATGGTTRLLERVA